MTETLIAKLSAILTAEIMAGCSAQFGVFGVAVGVVLSWLVVRRVRRVVDSIHK